MLEGNVLVLNRLFQPIQVTSVRRAITLFYKGTVHAVDSEYVTYDFENWQDIPPQPDQPRSIPGHTAGQFAAWPA